MFIHHLLGEKINSWSNRKGRGLEPGARLSRILFQGKWGNKKVEKKKLNNNTLKIERGVIMQNITAGTKERGSV